MDVEVEEETITRREVTIILREAVNSMTLENGHQAREEEGHVLVEPPKVIIIYVHFRGMEFIPHYKLNMYNITSFFQKSIQTFSSFFFLFNIFDSLC